MRKYGIMDEKELITDYLASQGVKSVTLARAARELSGFSLEEAAKRARISPRYLRRIEQRGAPYVLARRLAALYQCPIDFFLPLKRKEVGS